MFVPTSFTATYFGMRAGGYLRTVPDYPSARGNRTLEDFGVGEGIDLGIRFHERVALQAGGYGLARLGTNVDSLLGSGGQFEYGGHVGLLAKLLRVDATGTQLAVRTSFGVQGGQQVGMGSFASGLLRTVRGAINQVKNKLANSTVASNPELIENLDRVLETVTTLFTQADDLLLTPYSAWRGQFAVTAAQALGRYVGVQASVGLDVTRTRANPLLFRGTQPTVPVAITETAYTPTLGLVCDVDGAPLGIPLDVVLEYHPTFPRTRTVTTVAGKGSQRTSWRAQHVIGGGLYYSGRTDLQLGVLVHASFGQEPLTGPGPSQGDAQHPDDTEVRSAESGKPSETGAQFVFRYVW
jgi:hypothetical protein